MVRRVLVITALLVGLGACASADLDRDDVAGVVEGAFAAADADVSDIEVGPEPVDGRWTVSAEVEGRPLDLEVDAGAGRVVSIDFGTETVVLTQEQLEDVAAHAHNPAADRARRGRLLTTFVVFAALVAGGLAVARQLRLREEAQLASRTTTDATDT